MKGETGLNRDAGNDEMGAVGAAPLDGAAEGSTEATEPEEVRALRERVQDLEQQNLRLLADFENLRRRQRRDEEDLRLRLQQETVLALLPLSDDLERALAAGGADDPLHQGVTLVERGLCQLLERLGAAPIPSDGQPFDPNLHEAIGTEESDLAPGTVVAEIRRGYRVGERVVRAALVRVAKARE